MFATSVPLPNTDRHYVIIEHLYIFPLQVYYQDSHVWCFPCYALAVYKVWGCNCNSCAYVVLLTPLAVCTPECQNGGTCSSPGVCTCAPGWEGSRCTVGECVCVRACV